MDVSSVFHRAYSSLSKRIPDATDSNGIPSAGTYGFLTSFFKACKEFGNFSEYLFALDVKGSTGLRKKLNSDYKGTRKKQTNNFYLDKNNLINYYFPLFDIVPLGLKDYEADDIIASSCKYISNNYKDDYHIYIMSGDGDLEMCTKYTDKISFIKTQPKWELKSYQDILSKWDLDNPNDIPILKAISGDSSDNIEGIYGYKKKKALKVYKDITFLNKHNDIIQKNLSLITLKDDLDAVPRPINISLDKLQFLFEKLNSPSLLKRMNTIYKLFS